MSGSTGDPRASTPFLVELEGVLADRLNRLIAAPLDQLDDAILAFQRELCRLLGTDRCVVWQVTEAEPTILRVTHPVSIDERVATIPRNVIANDAFPWIAAELLAGRVVAVPDVSDLPPEAAVDRATFARIGSKSSLAIPIADVSGRVWGAIGFGATQVHEAWSETVVAHCRLVAQFLHSALRRKQADEAFREERMWLRAVLESTSSDMIWCVDAKRFGLVAWNRVLSGTFDHYRSHALERGETPEDLFPNNPEVVAIWRSLYERVLREGAFSTEYRTPAGRPIMELELDVVRRDGEVVGISVFGRDVTAQRASNEELARVQQQLVQAQKMEAIGRLAGGIAHDFNNLLTVISAFTDDVIAKLGDGSPLTEDLKQVATASERAADLTSQLLTFSRQQPRQPRVLDLASIAEQAERMLRRMLPENIQLVLVDSGDDTHVLADQGQLHQVIMNLAVNAKDAMPRGGRLEIGVDQIIFDAASAQPRGVPAGAYVRLRVRDQGEGIAPENLERVFEPFFTTKPRGQGTGLGLSTVLGIVKSSGGEVHLDSEVGVGTTVEVLLPHTAAPAPRPRVATPTPSAASETVLLVEDDEQVRTILARILRSAGHEVLVAASGEEALRIAEVEQERLDLLLTDVIMPGMSGDELARRLRAQLPSLAVLFSSGFSDAPLEELRALSSGPLLMKPYTRDEVHSAIRTALARRNG